MPDVYTYTAVTRVTPSGGSVVGGTPVTITGFGFDSFFTGSVTLDGVAATSIVVVSNTTITAVTPAHNAGAVDVVVSGIGILTAGYTYTVVRTMLPRVPVLDEKRTLDGVELAKFLMAAKKAIETAPTISGGQIVTPIDPDLIPQLPYTRIDLTESPRLLGRTTAGAGEAEQISVAGGLSLSGGVLSMAGLPSGFVVGDLLYAISSTQLARLADVSVGSYLRSGGVATAPLWSTLKLPNAATSGDILKASGADTYASVAPQALSRVNDTNVTLTLGGTPLTALVNAASLTLGWTGELSLTRGGTAAALVAVNGGIVYSGAAALAISAAGSSGQLLRSGGAGAPTWSTATFPSAATPAGAYLRADGTNWITSTLILPNAITAGSVVFGSATNTYGQDNANLFWDDSNNRLGIGVNTSLTAPLHVKSAGTTSSTNTFLFEDSGGTDLFAQRDDSTMGFGKDITLPAAAGFIYLRTGAAFGGACTITNNINGINSLVGAIGIQLRYAGTQEFGVATGIGVVVESSNTHAGNVLTAVSGSSRIATASGLATTLIGGSFDVRSDGSTGATITTLAGVRATMLVQNAGVTATSAYGLQITDITNSGTMTNTYGIHIGDVTAGTQTNQAYSLYSSDTAALNYFGGAVQCEAKVTRYNAIATAGWGVPAIYGSGRSTAQTAAVASVTAYTVGAADGSFIVSANVNVTTSTTHNFAVQVTYTDETNTARTLVMTLSTEAGTLVIAITNVTGAGIYDGVPLHIRAKAATAITVKTAGTFTTVTYNVEGLIQQVA